MSPVYQVAKVHCVSGNAGVLIERIAFSFSRKIASCFVRVLCVSLRVCVRERERER